MANDNLLMLADKYYQACTQLKLARLRKLPSGKWRVLSRTGKNLGTFDTREEAAKHLGEVEYFKKKKASEDGTIDLTDIHDLSYSAIMRELRKQCDKETVTKFLTIFKHCFDKLVKNEVEDPSKLALSLSLKLFNQSHPLKLNLQKEASITELGDAVRVGQYLGDIIRFTMMRISPEKRAKSMQTVMRKVYLLNENELAMKNMPPTSAIGQSVTFVKHVLFNQPPQYIREVLNNIVARLRY